MTELRINSLPAPTWNWLKVNDTYLKVSDKTEALTLDANVPSTLKSAADAEAFWTGLDAESLELSAGEEFKKYMAAAEKSSLSVASDSINKEAVRVDITEDAEAVNGEFAVTKNASLRIAAADDAEITVFYNVKANASLTLDTRIRAGKNAKVTLVEVFNLGADAEIIDSIGGDYEETATFKLVQVVLGGKDVNIGAVADLNGKKSNLIIDTGYVAAGKEKLDINYVARHRGVKTDTKINVNGVLRDEALKNFRGTIDFIRGCHEAKGDEREDVLLMNEDVVNKTVPLILCAEEDVEGTHGASIGKISDEELFYFETRGIPETAVQELMAQSRIDAVVGRIENDEIRTYLQENLLKED